MINNGQGPLSAAVASSVAAMPWLTAVDGATVAVAEQYASQVEGDDPESISRLFTLGPHLLATLEALGGTPLARARQRMR